MAQTTTGMNSLSSVVEVSADNTTYVDISGSLEMMTPEAQSRGVGQRLTIDGAMAIVMSGRKEPHTINLSGVFTETAGEAYKTLETIWNSTDGTIYLKYYPDGKTSGNMVISSGKSILSAFGHPPIDANSNDPLPFTAAIYSPGFTSATYTTAG